MLVYKWIFSRFPGQPFARQPHRCLSKIRRGGRLSATDELGGVTFATFASKRTSPQNAKFSAEFQAVFVNKHRETKAQSAPPLAQKERVLRHINGAPPQCTQKQKGGGVKK